MKRRDVHPRGSSERRFGSVMGARRGLPAAAHPSGEFGPNSEQVTLLLAAVADTSEQQRDETPVGVTDPARAAHERVTSLLGAAGLVAESLELARQLAVVIDPGVHPGAFTAASRAAQALMVCGELTDAEFAATVGPCRHLIGFTHPVLASRRSR